MYLIEIFIVILLFMVLWNQIDCEEYQYVFRDSQLMYEVQMRQVFDDPQDFLRMKLAKPQKEILNEFRELKLFELPTAKRKGVLKEFVKKNFENVTGLEPWVPPDFKKVPNTISKIKDDILKDRLVKLNQDWLKYGRKISENVSKYPEMYSLIYVPRPFFVSSNEQQEMGYWESFWILQGLLACDMLQSAKNILENLLSIVHRVGYCPPYNRVYYLGRTSPPLLPLMMASYLSRTNDTDFLAAHLTELDADLTAWVQQRFTILRSPFHIFLIVVDDWLGQVRPERYREDILTLLNHAPSSLSGPREFLWDVENSVLKTSVFLTTVTEASAKQVATWLREYGYKARARFFDNISKEMNYTLLNLLKIGDCWSDLHIDKGYALSLSSLSPMWQGLHFLPCESARKLAATVGPEAVIASGEQARKWISSICRVKVDNLVDISCAFQIARMSENLTLQHPERVESTKVKAIPFWEIVVVAIVLKQWIMSFYDFPSTVQDSLEEEDLTEEEFEDANGGDMS